MQSHGKLHFSGVWLCKDLTWITWIVVPLFLPYFHVLRPGLINSYHTLLLLIRISSARQAPSLIHFKEFQIRSFKLWGSLFATLILFWILQVCCGICPPMTSWSTCWLEKPCRRWLKLFSSLTLAGQIEIIQSQVFYLTLISSTMPRDAWGEHSVYKYPKQ